MAEEDRFRCSACRKPIGTEEVVEVYSVDRATFERLSYITLYFHLMSDMEAEHSTHCGGRGCYGKWTRSRERFMPHGMRIVAKREVLEGR